jgi:flagellar protein FliS
MHPALARKQNSGVNQYLVNDIMSSTQEKLLLKVYDYAITNCRLHNLEKTNKAIRQLISGLKFDDENSDVNNFSIGIYRLYMYCQDQMRKKNYEVVERILTELRESWTQTFKKLNKI